MNSMRFFFSELWSFKIFSGFNLSARYLKKNLSKRLQLKIWSADKR